MTDWKEVREGLRRWFGRVANVSFIEWKGEPELQYPANKPYATLELVASGEIGTGWEHQQYNEAKNQFDVEQVSDKRAVLYAKIVSPSQLAGEDAFTFMNRAETLARGNASFEELLHLGLAYHGTAGPIAKGDYEHQGHDVSQANLEFVLSYRSIIKDEPILTIERLEGTITAKDTPQGDAEIPFGFNITLTPTQGS